jgi:GH25 family lysozyme M1 (1,4-beta-N-acetylmuramidase)
MEEREKKTKTNQKTTKQNIKKKTLEHQATLLNIPKKPLIYCYWPFIF